MAAENGDLWENIEAKELLRIFMAIPHYTYLILKILDDLTEPISQRVQQKDEFVVGLRFSFHKMFNIYLHQLTPNAIVSLWIFIWVVQSHGVELDFLSMLFSKKDALDRKHNEILGNYSKPEHRLNHVFYVIGFFYPDYPNMRIAPAIEGTWFIMLRGKARRLLVILVDFTFKHHRRKKASLKKQWEGNSNGVLDATTPLESIHNHLQGRSIRLNYLLKHKGFHIGLLKTPSNYVFIANEYSASH
ncbi:hypothetical protein ACJX0J_014565 [Zea mays]